MKTFRYVTGLPEVIKLPTIESKVGRFYITPGGNTVPSVTTVLGYAKRDVIADWRQRIGEEEANRISSRAAARGTRFHNLCEKYFLNKKNILEGIMPDLRQVFKDVQKTLDRIDNIHYIEASLHSEELGIAGRTDIIGEFDGILSVIDLKTSTRIKQEDHIIQYFEQAAAYALMYEELTGVSIDQLVIIIAVEDDIVPQVFVRNKDDYVLGLLEKIVDYKRNHLDVS